MKRRNHPMAVLLMVALVLVMTACNETDAANDGSHKEQSAGAQRETGSAFYEGKRFQQETVSGAVTLQYGENEWQTYTTGRVNPFEVDLLIELDGVSYKRGDQVQKLLDNGWQYSNEDELLGSRASKDTYLSRIFTKENRYINVLIMNLSDEEIPVEKCHIGGFGYYNHPQPGQLIVAGVDIGATDIAEICEAFYGLEYHSNPDGTIGCSAWVRDSSCDLSLFSVSFWDEDNAQDKQPGDLAQFDITWDFERLQTDYRE